MDKIIENIEEGIKNGLEKAKNNSIENMGINIIIDSSDIQQQIFVEIENDNGESIRIGEEMTDADGFRKLRITTADIINHLNI